MAPGDGPLDFQFPPSGDRDANLLFPPLTLDLVISFLFFLFCFVILEPLLLVGLDKEVQVEMVHAVLDVVPVGSDQILVVVDLRLQRSNYIIKKLTQHNRRRKTKRKKTRYLSEEVADDDLGQGVSQTAQLVGNHKSDQFFFNSRRFLIIFFFLMERVRALPCARPSAPIPLRTG